MAKDLFSSQAEAYARYRPGYPRELFDYIISFVEEKDRAWDCATGNGQAALGLAPHFKIVEATDLSASQLQRAKAGENIRYQQAPAEQTPFPSHYFNLITIATAYHWLNWEKFRTEAQRVAKPGCVIAAWAYNLVESENEKINQVTQWFYKDITGPYWDKERRFVDESYRTVQFEFEPLPEKQFELRLAWDKSSYLGFLKTWSAVQQYINAKHTDPVQLAEKELDFWKDEEMVSFRFPLFLRLGRIQ